MLRAVVAFRLPFGPRAIGVGRPPGRMDAADYVLRDFDASERAELPDVLDRAARAIETFVAHGIGVAMNAHNRTAENASP